MGSMWVVRSSAAILTTAALVLGGCGAGSTSPPSGTTSGAPATGGAHARASSVRLVVRRAGTLPAAVQLPAVAGMANGSALVMGGLDAADASVDNVVSVGAGGVARVVGRLPAALHDGAAAAIGSTAFFIGGGDAGAGKPEILRVSAGGGVRSAGRLPVGASDVEAAAVGRSIYLVGGYTGTVPLRSIFAIDAGGKVRAVAELPHPLRYAAVAAVGGRVLIAGGTSGSSATSDVFAFDPATARVRRIARLPNPLTHAAGAALGGRFYVIGGRGDSLTSQHRAILSIDPATGRIRRAGVLPAALSDTGAASFADHITVVGGRDSGGTVHASILRLSIRRVTAAAPTARTASDPQAGRIPALLNPHDVYAAGRPGALSPVVRNDPPRVYVPNSQSNTVDVIDQRTGRRIAHWSTGALPQHVTPSWDLRHLYVTNDAGNSLTPIDPRTGRHGAPIPVLDPYNLYFTADGRRAIVVAEAHRELDFRTPHTFKLTHSLKIPQCAGIDHMDFTANGRLALVSCEFAGRMVVVDLIHERVIKTIDLRPGSMPQDVKISPDGHTFYVADMAQGGVWLIGAQRLAKLGFVATGAGAHGLYPSRDSRVLYVSNRNAGTVSLISFRTRRPFRTWRIPGHASPDMGGVSADGRVLWLTGRYDAELYAISTRTGRLLHRIPVGSGPHGACVWPQPGRYSIGHTGILR
jgi:YVTN family beta-propeller protein